MTMMLDRIKTLRSPRPNHAGRVQDVEVIPKVQTEVVLVTNALPYGLDTEQLRDYAMAEFGVLLSRKMLLSTMVKEVYELGTKKLRGANDSNKTQ